MGVTTTMPVSSSSAGETVDPSETDPSGSGSESGSSTTSADACAGVIPAIVTDIDETLTLSDEEFTMQLQDGNYDPVERDDAAEMVNAYADLGYHVLYLTARAESFMTMVTDETAREATERWLDEHGFPNDEDTTTLILAPAFYVQDDDTIMYKAGAIDELTGMGYRFDYAYGNADTDIIAYDMAGIPKDATFTIGELAGEMDTVAIEEEGYTQHVADHIPTVPEACP